MFRKIFSAVIFTALFVFAQSVYAQPNIDFQGHVEGYGWMRPVGNGQVIGTTGEGRRLEALIINFDGDIRYSAHVQNIGWQRWAYSGDVAGTVGEGLRMEAIRIQLDDHAAQYYDIYYRAHVEQLGWLGWACNGEPAGTVGAGLRMEALQIELVPRGERFHRGRGPAFYQG